ncbi:MAG TPA: hypothetical protein ENJ28_04245 [Gammaproteobacteria bacterium]|nr:hypothetical protein [Gammaproteobacteria bacterium]
MIDCNKEQSFFKYFKENMNSLGLKVPSSLFDTQSSAVLNASAILAAIKLLGPKATLAEVAGATVALEKLAVLGALSASYYLGAVVGSIAVATGRYLGCGKTIADYFVLIESQGLMTPELNRHLNQYQIILNTELPNRLSYGGMAREVIT